MCRVIGFEFDATGSYSDARFFVGTDANRWNETYVRYKRTGQDSDFQTSPVPSVHTPTNVEIELNRMPVEHLRYLSVVSNQHGMLGHALLNSGSSFFKSQQVVAIVFASLFSAFYLY
jgi:hypothetical protein